LAHYPGMIKWRELSYSLQMPPRCITPRRRHRGDYEFQVRPDISEAGGNGAHTFNFTDRSSMDPYSEISMEDPVCLRCRPAQPLAAALRVPGYCRQYDGQSRIPKRTIKPGTKSAEVVAFEVVHRAGRDIKS